MSRVHSASLHTRPGKSARDARLVAELRAFALAVRLVGLDGIRAGHVTFASSTERTTNDA